MARRSNALIPLSWDHHHGLSLARTIRATLEGEPRFGNPSPRQMRDMVAVKWTEELKGHFTDEEQLLGPLAEETAEMGALLNRMREEHAQIRQLVAEIAECEKDNTEPLARFAQTLGDHIRFEESILFEAVEALLDEEAQRALGESLLDLRQRDGRGSERERRAVRGEL